MILILFCYIVHSGGFWSKTGIMHTIEIECTFGSDSIGNFMKYRIAKLLFLSVAVISSTLVTAKDLSSDYGVTTYIQSPFQGTSADNSEVNDPKAKDPLPISDLFQRTSLRSGLSTFEGVLKDASFLEMDAAILQTWLSKDAPEVHLSLPLSSRSELLLELREVHLLTDDFKITTDMGDFDMTQFKGAKFYKGSVQGHTESLVSFSVLDDQVIGVISIDGMSQILHKMEKEDIYILYYSDDLMVSHPFTCGVDDDDLESRGGEDAEESEGDNREQTVPCIRVFMECDFALYTEKGGVINAANWIAAVFNNVAALYQAESIILTLSEIFVWTSKDPYSTKSSVTALNQFRTVRKNFNGDIAHLAALGGHSLGGVAWLDVICNSGYRYGYSNIHSTYQDVPVFSWSVEVIAHEIGHNLGSRHTHWCGWQGGPIDDCYVPEGKCTKGPAPENGGTIMSYCHLSGSGINFNKGFGPQPGDRIRSRVVNATCLTSCALPPSGMCGKPGELQLINVSHETAIMQWQKGIGASKYLVSYKLKNAEEWTVISQDTNVFVISGLSINTWYCVKVQSKCDTTLSPASSVVEFRTLNESEYCQSKGQSTLMEWIELVELANIRRVSASDNGYADASHLVANMETGKTYTLTFKAGMNRANFNEFWRMWIDYNQNGRFDEDELVFGRISSSSAPMTRAIRIPASAKSGLTKMRIAMKYGAHATACETFEYGEVEDYSINVINGSNLLVAEENSDLEVFPNPARDWLIIKNITRMVTGDQGLLTIYNMLGNVVWSQSLNNTDESQELSLNIENWPAGQYILSRNQDNLNTQHKFLKL